MYNKGLSQHRFKQNPLEKKFAQAWEKINTALTTQKPDGHGTLDYMLAGNTNDPRGEVTPRDRQVAATVVQWLGSPVGEAFVKHVLGIKR